MGFSSGSGRQDALAARDPVVVRDDRVKSRQPSAPAQAGLGSARNSFELEDTAAVPVEIINCCRADEGAADVEFNEAGSQAGRIDPAGRLIAPRASWEVLLKKLSASLERVALALRIASCARA
jgi:hypothetical protein